MVWPHHKTQEIFLFIPRNSGASFAAHRATGNRGFTTLDLEERAGLPRRSGSMAYVLQWSLITKK